MFDVCLFSGFCLFVCWWVGFGADYCALVILLLSLFIVFDVWWYFDLRCCLILWILIRFIMCCSVRCSLIVGFDFRGWCVWLRMVWMVVTSILILVF